MDVGEIEGTNLFMLWVMLESQGLLGKKVGGGSGFAAVVFDSSGIVSRGWEAAVSSFHTGIFCWCSSRFIFSFRGGALGMCFVLQAVHPLFWVMVFLWVLIFAYIRGLIVCSVAMAPLFRFISRVVALIICAVSKIK